MIAAQAAAGLLLGGPLCHGLLHQVKTAVAHNVYCADDPDEPVFGYVNISLVSIMDGVLDSRYEKYRVKEPLIPVSPADYAYMSSLGYSPVDMVEVEGGDPVVGWGKARCYDCVAAGGTLEKPEFD